MHNNCYSFIRLNPLSFISASLLLSSSLRNMAVLNLRYHSRTWSSEKWPLTLLITPERICWLSIDHASGSFFDSFSGGRRLRDLLVYMFHVQWWKSLRSVYIYVDELVDSWDYIQILCLDHDPFVLVRLIEHFPWNLLCLKFI